MNNFKTNIPALDNENIILFKASEVLERLGNEPNPTADQFYAQLVNSDFPAEEHEGIILAAISIETMMQLDTLEDMVDPTIH